jgi:hypothetical protein
MDRIKKLIKQLQLMCQAKNTGIYWPGLLRNMANEPNDGDHAQKPGKQPA